MDAIKEFFSKYKVFILSGLGVAALLLVLWFVLRTDLSEQVALPYISHQQPRVDPHLLDAVDLSDKLDEVLFDGLFNVSANPSGIVYEDALGEWINLDEENNIVTIRLNTKRKWHSSYTVTVDDDDINVAEAGSKFFTAEDLKFTLNRIRRLGSLSPDYILVSQALKSWEFTGPDRNDEIRFQFKDDRDWGEADIKEVLTFKILPANSDFSAVNYTVGSGPYLTVDASVDVSSYFRSPDGTANIPQVNLIPFVDNSTFTTEFKNGNFNVLLTTPFGSKSPILEDTEDFFYKSNISSTFFALLMNTQRLSLEQRQELKKLVNGKTLLDRFYKVGTPQQRHIADFKGNQDNYDDYLNYSVFPTSSYYVDAEIVVPVTEREAANLAILPDSLNIVANINSGHREEYIELIEILNDDQLFGGKLRASAVGNDVIKSGDYDALLIAIDGYKSTFFFDLYNIFLREPDFDQNKINLVVQQNAKGENVADPRSLNGSNNFCRIDASNAGSVQAQVSKFLDYMHGFMYTNHLGDRQHYAGEIAVLEEELGLGVWLFSLPSMAYFSTQFEEATIDLYGTASQLSTIEKWRERKD